MTTPYPYAGPETLREPIEQALRRIVDPEVAMTIVDIGLVYGVTVEDRRVQVRLTMTSAACPIADQLVDEVGQELARIPELDDIDVELVWDPPWTTDRMSAHAKAFMGW